METKNTAVHIQQMENRSIKSLKSLLSDITDPVFVADKDSDVIFIANDAAITACGSLNPAGELLKNVVHFESDDIKSTPVYFDKKWWVPFFENIYWNKKSYRKLVLKQAPSIPNEHTLFTIRNLIEVLLHRLRSPMTGMQGYLDMVQDVSSDNDKRKLAKVGEGLGYLFDIMDELELFHHAEAFMEDEPTATKSDAVRVINDLLDSWPNEMLNRVEVMYNTEEDFLFNPTELSRVLSLLLKNAAEHSSAATQPIKIEIHSSRQISITNFGTPISDDVVENLFFPFVTSRANNLGIGLSLAQLMANRRRAVILLRENSAEKGITFSLLCSPQDTC